MLTTLEVIDNAQDKLAELHRKKQHYEEAIDAAQQREAEQQAQAQGQQLTGQPYAHAEREAKEARNSATKYKALHAKVLSDICAVELAIRDLRQKANEEHLAEKAAANKRLRELGNQAPSLRDALIHPFAHYIAATAAREGIAPSGISPAMVTTNPYTQIETEVRQEAQRIYEAVALGEVQHA